MQSYGDWIWISSSSKQATEFDIPFAGKVIKCDRGRTLVETDDNEELWIDNQQILKPIHISSYESVHDMINLGDLQEYAILRNLDIRYKQKLIYTYIGSMLVAINPYEVLNIYTNSQISIYKDKRNSTHKNVPHIFAIGSNSYHEMNLNKSNQCIVISGESGAGKTESTKLILQYLAAVSGKHSWIEQQILEANPVLEAFGNAKTIRNDNSSRFGKYIDVFFNQLGVIEGARIEHYLLEKSRIVAIGKGERNYHIFYALLAGLSRDKKKKLDLEDATKYTYLTGGNVIRCEGRDDIQEFNVIENAMKILSFSDDEIWETFKLLAAILHFGNLKFKATVVQNIDACEINDNLNITKVSNLLGIPKQHLIQGLTQKTIFAHGEKVTSSLAKDQAIESRDAFVKAIYGNIFLRIVDKINKTIFRETKNRSSIGVLDIFGFENFDNNSFEQLCINYANENLQQFFVKHIFKVEQEEYNKEGINWQNIKFIDNQEILDMIGHKPMNIMALIDEETKFPKGTDITLLAKLHSTHSVKTIYMKPKSDNSILFGIQHFAGGVYYDPNGFLEKNRDSFSLDLKELVLQSSNKFLLNLFSDDSLNTISKKSITLSLQFRNSLELLMKTLHACHPFFIRCIKPNELQRSNILDKALCVRQLRYSGMMETAKIRQAGYAIRHTYRDFVTRYRFLVKDVSIHGDSRNAAKRICTEILKDNPSYAFGKTKIFLKNDHDKILENNRMEVYQRSVLILQRAFRRVLFRRYMRRYREAAIVIQKHWRARGPRKRYLVMKNGFSRLQAVLHSRQLTFEFRSLRNVIISFQAHCRGFLTRKNLIGKINEKSRKVTELIILRRREEHDFKRAGNPYWREQAEANFLARMGALNKELQIDKEAELAKARKDPHISIEEQSKIVEDVFGFLNELSSPPPVNRANKKPSFNEISTQTTIPKSHQFTPREDDLSEYSFQKFAATYFTSNVSHQYSKKHLKNSLLDLPIVDQFSSQALWITILRFLGDMAEAKFDNDDESTKNIHKNVMENLTQTIGKSFAKSQDYQELMKYEPTEANRKLIHRTLKRKSNLPKEVKDLIENSDSVQSYQSWLNTRSSTLEKLHFIIGHGILRKELRDEIYCQICKQLTNNPSDNSYARGWILLSLCLGCFAPTPYFEKYLRLFIRNGPDLFAPYCEDRLDRTILNGTRKQPPSWLELQATKVKSTISTKVHLMDGTQKELELDSASTSEEVCREIAKSIQLKDLLGFSLFISIFDKVLPLGCEREHIMDAISKCEQYCKEQGIKEKYAEWKLFFQKEMFAPWHNPTDDEVATNLIYHQIVNGIHSGDYVCNSEKDVAMVAALQYYADNGTQFSVILLRQSIHNYLPKFLYRKDKVDKWVKLIEIAYSKCRCNRDRLEPLAAKEDIVLYAKLTWGLKFSRFFEVMNVNEENTNNEFDNSLILAINWTGVYLIDNQEKVLVELSYAEIQNVFHDFDYDSDDLGILIIQTITDEYFKLKSFDSYISYKLLNYLLMQLKKKSIYVVALHNYSKESSPDSDESYLRMSKGDLIILEKGFTGENLMNSKSTWAFGACNNNFGYFPIDMVYILPCIQKPNQEILNLFKKDRIKKTKTAAFKYNTIQRSKMHTMRKFAGEFFRPNIEVQSLPSGMNTLKKQHGELWSHSKEPIKAPLLMKLQNQTDNFDKAVMAFVWIMRYMGDLPQMKDQLETDHIFKAAILGDIMKDEIYCQIMKQLTENPVQISEERGWDLMWLATGIMTPTIPALLKELQEFLKSRPHPIAKECLIRLHKTMKSGNRSYPPHVVEVESIRNRSMQIYHKIYFPDDTDEAFQIESSTKAIDIIHAIVSSFKLKSHEGFSLFIKVADKVLSIPENQYIFDFICEINEWMNTNLPTRGRDKIVCQYQLFFLRKMWINFVPGKDRIADDIFHFHQEYPKYSNGYYKISKSEAPEFGALIYRAYFGDDQKRFQNLQGLANMLIPDDLVKNQKTDEWKRQIMSIYLKQDHLTDSDAKLEFLKKLQKQEIFGSTFFVVKQKSSRNLPEAVLIAINKNGFHIIDAVTKEILKSYLYADMSFWSSGNNYFQITFGNLLGGSNLLCETTQGYKMDDLLASYINYYRSIDY